MKKLGLHLYEGFFKTKTVIMVFVALLYIVLTVFSGGSLWQLLLFGACILGYIVLPGLFFARLLNVKKWSTELFGPLAILLGTGFLAALYCLTMRLGILWVLQVFPPIVGLMGFALQIKEKGASASIQRVVRYRPSSAQWMLILLFAALLLIYSFAGIIKNALPTAVGDVLINQDLLWNVGNANSFKIAFPPQDIRFYDVRLHYHYLTEMVAGILSIVSGISAYNVIAFYMQPYVLAALILCLFRFGKIVFKGNLFKSILFPYSLFLFSCASLWKVLPDGWSVFWNSNITHLITNINSQATGVLFLCIFGGLFITAARNKYKMDPVFYLVILASFFMLTMAKGPLAAIVVCSMVVTLLIGLFQKNTGWRGLLLGAAIVAIFAVTYVVMFSSGANESMKFSLAGTLNKGYFANILARLNIENQLAYKIAVPCLWLLQTFLMMPAVAPLYVRGLVGDVRHFASLPQEKLLFHGVAVGGTAAFFLFDHPALSQAYFLYAAIFFVCLLAVDYTDYLRPLKKETATKAKKVLHGIFVGGVALFAAVGFATTAFLYIHHIGSGARRLAWNMGIVEKYPYDVVVTPDDENAMTWLEENTGSDIMFATNRIHTGAREEGISNLYSALSGRQGYMEGFQYAVTNMGVSQEIVSERYETNQKLFAAETSPAEVVELCREKGIDYLVYSTQMKGSNQQMGDMELVFDSSTIQIYKVPDAG